MARVYEEHPEYSIDYGYYRKLRQPPDIFLRNGIYYECGFCGKPANPEHSLFVGLSSKPEKVTMYPIRAGVYQTTSRWENIRAEMARCKNCAAKQGKRDEKFKIFSLCLSILVFVTSMIIEYILLGVPESSIEIFLILCGALTLAFIVAPTWFVLSFIYLNPRNIIIKGYPPIKKLIDKGWSLGEVEGDRPPV